MRVITGSARGRKLKTPEGGDIVRPTTDKVKEAMFSIVQFEVPDAVVLDAFAGCGQLGIEALSRGAKKAYFVEENRKAFEIVKENLQATGLFQKAVALQTDIFAFVRTAAERFDLVFLDPPYAAGLLPKLLPKLSDCCNAGALVVCETDFSEELPEMAGDLVQLRTYKYSKTKLTTYRKREDAE